MASIQKDWCLQQRQPGLCLTERTARSKLSPSRMDFVIVPIYSLGRPWDDKEQRFDLSRLPFEVAPGLTIEDVRPLIDDEASDRWRGMLGELLFERAGRIKHALVHRYEPGSTPLTGTRDLAELAAACLSLIRPMRKEALRRVRGEIRADGTLLIKGFSVMDSPKEVGFIEAHSSLTLRTQDAEELRTLLPRYLKGLLEPCWKFRMAAQLHEIGYFQQAVSDIKLVTWVSAIEALFTCEERQPQGAQVAVDRIKWFLGENTPLYTEQDSPFPPRSQLRVGDILWDLCEIVNCAAHGEQIPSFFNVPTCRRILTGRIDKGEVLCEGASFIVRESLTKILRQNLLEQFRNTDQAKQFFAAHGL